MAVTGGGTLSGSQAQATPGYQWTQSAKRRDQTLGSIPWDFSGSLVEHDLNLFNSGYLQQLRLFDSVTGTWSVAPTATDPVLTYSGGLKRIIVSANSVAKFFDCDGVAANVITAIQRSYDGNAISFPPTPSTVTATPGTAAFTDSWVYEIPIAIYLRNREYPLGLYQTAMNSLQVRVGTIFTPTVATAGAPLSGLYVSTGTLGTSSGAVSVVQRYFDPIQAAAGQPPLTYIHQWTQMQFPLTSDGDTVLGLPPNNYYTRLIYMIYTGAPGSVGLDNNHLTNLKLGWGADIFPFNETLNHVQSRMQADYGFTLPAGIYTHDMIQQTHDERDWIDSRAATNLRAVITMSGATYTGGAFVNVAMEQMLPLYATAGGTA